MSEQRRKQIRTALQSMVALAIVATSIDLGVLVDGLKKIGFDTTGLGLVKPETAAAIVATLGVVAGFVTKAHQWLDKTPVPSLAGPEAAVHADPDTDDGSGAEGEQVA